MRPKHPQPLTNTFLDDAIRHMETMSVTSPTLFKKYADVYLPALQDEDCRRVLFDAAQAQQFAPLVEFPARWGAVRAPFDQFYMEFSEPVEGNPTAWSVYPHDRLRALLYGRAAPLRVVDLATPIVGRRSTMREVEDVALVLCLFEDPVAQVYSDRNFFIALESGETYVSVYSATQRESEPDGGPRWMVDDNANARRAAEPQPEYDRSTGLEGIEPFIGDPRDDNAVFFVAGSAGEHRHVGFWERQALALSSFLRWCLAYMTAKSIVIERTEVPVSRQVRRALQRAQKPLPAPWHVVKVDPKVSRQQDAEGSAKRGPSYRYDVMGHLRVNRHRVGSKKADGTYEYRQTLEWVHPHMRGLAAEAYIPKTRAVTAERAVLSELRQPEL